MLGGHQFIFNMLLSGLLKAEQIDQFNISFKQTSDIYYNYEEMRIKERICTFNR